MTCLDLKSVYQDSLQMADKLCALKTIVMLKTALATNTDGRINKLVMVFAQKHPAHNCNNKSKTGYRLRDRLYPDSKNHAVPSLHRDSFPACRDRFVAVLASGNAYEIIPPGRYK